jgi:hypothetical protein
MNDFSLAQAFTPGEGKAAVSKAPLMGLLKLIALYSQAFTPWLVRLKARVVREVQVLSRQTLSGL